MKTIDRAYKSQTVLKGWFGKSLTGGCPLAYIPDYMVQHTFNDS